MGIPIEYNTILNHAFAEYEEKKSRFIANVKPVVTEEEAIDFIEKIRNKYKDASHNIYAYSICCDNIIQRFSDDGEPSGTAGLPVLETINKLGLFDLVIVVTRYFGGILLGTAGLARAYGRAALIGIKASNIIKKRLCNKVSITFEYTILGKIQNQIVVSGYEVEDMTYEDKVTIVLWVPINDMDIFIEFIKNISNGKASIKIEEKKYIACACGFVKFD